ncbi:endo alpha-1,4 polygalactosaminidase [Nocardioides sp. KC13]|uniref:Endo alpha-1,4 polygalactosaminidase n=1 Tax=Nocardioides turkmenicus TaxID=2711220 RepID=A0A6M1QR93_9ACTN|nr:endo alpha-1,4 polygalactosaminidase [Nocardioides sp. KC13]NGN92355.1 endo alpha-1,4 polygalactosaminidase [Nocardioides sp. KC13]
MFALAGCGSPSVALPPTDGVFDYQLGGLADRLTDGTPIDVVVRDATAQPLEGAYNVCYVNGFQTQPGADWSDHPAALLRDASGNPVRDPDWPDEIVLDPSTATARSSILEMVGPAIESCAQSGFDAVEIDNLDTWTRFDSISRDGAFALASAYVTAAHDLGLAIAQKNAAEAARTAHDDLGFDFAVVEECGAYSECAAYTDVYGPHVLQIEYPDSLAEAGHSFADVCADPHHAPLTILRDRDLVGQDDAAYVYEAC